MTIITQVADADAHSGLEEVRVALLEKFYQEPIDAHLLRDVRAEFIELCPARGIEPSRFAIELVDQVILITELPSRSITL